VGSELLDALRAADSATPLSLEAFDRIVGDGAPCPDLYEHSIRGGDPIAPHRLTVYFDTHRGGAPVARVAGERFIRLCEQLGLRLPSALSRFVVSPSPAAPEVLQVVLGIDATAGHALRGKYYLVFRDDPTACLRDLFLAVDLAALPDADASRTYIIGLDVTSAGLADVKLYSRLHARRVPEILDNAKELADLLAASRDVVFQRCLLRPGRRQLYVHATSSERLARWLAGRGFEPILARAQSLHLHLARSRAEPWIVSFAYADGRVDLRGGCVYFHLVHADA
jgi:hypothetical protein